VTEIADQSIRAEHTKEAGHGPLRPRPQVARHRGADMVTISPLRLVHTWREQQVAKRTDVLAERILGGDAATSGGRQGRTLFSTELLTKFVGAEPARVFRALRKLERDRLIFKDDMTGRCILTDKPLLKR
jgi:hypothetical protein